MLCSAHGASAIRARQHIPYWHRYLRVCACAHVRGARVCACAPSRVRARVRSGKGAHRSGALCTREGALSTREYDRMACVRAGSGLRGLAAHTARVPAVLCEYRVSTAGGAAVKITEGLIATAFVALQRGFITLIVARCSCGLYRFITTFIPSPQPVWALYEL